MFVNQERDRSLQKLKALRTPIVALGVFTLVCAFLDLLAVLIRYVARARVCVCVPWLCHDGRVGCDNTRLWAFKDIEMNEIAPSVLLLLLGLAFCSIDLSAVRVCFCGHPRAC